jgi:hypothetical protein
VAREIHHHRNKRRPRMRAFRCFTRPCSRPSQKRLLEECRGRAESAGKGEPLGLDTEGPGPQRLGKQDSRTSVATGQAASGRSLAGSETNRHLYSRVARQIESIAVSCAARFWDPARPWARPSKPGFETRRAKMAVQLFPPEDKIETNARSGLRLAEVG